MALTIQFYNTLSAILMKKTKIKMTNKLPRMPILPITLWTTLDDDGAWLLAMKMLPVKFSNEDAVMLFQTSLEDDVFSISAEDSQLSAAATRLFYTRRIAAMMAIMIMWWGSGAAHTYAAWLVGLCDASGNCNCRIDCWTDWWYVLLFY